MAKKVRTHIGPNDSLTVDLTPSHLTKHEFAKRLYKLMASKGWTQSELARKSGLERAAISTYMRAKSLPTPSKLAALAAAFGVEPEILLPNHLEAAINEDAPSFEMKVSVSAPGMAWVRVNRLLSVNTAVKIASLLEADDATNGSGGGRKTSV